MENAQFMGVLEETRRKLTDHDDEWRHRYALYAEQIKANLPFLKSIRSSFHEWTPLNVHMSISSAKNSCKNSISFDLRYRGQTVATLKAKKDTRHKLTTAGYEGINKTNFECDKPSMGVAWDGKEAKEFRRFFKKRENGRIAGAQRIFYLRLTDYTKITNLKSRMYCYHMFTWTTTVFYNR